MLENTISHIVSLTQRLATTIPTVTKQQSHLELLSQLYFNATTSQSLYDLLILTIIVVSALELVSHAVYHIPKLGSVNSIPVRGKHLDRFALKDYVFIGINKCMTGIFVYLYFGYLWSVRKGGASPCSCCGGGKGIWKLDDLSLVRWICLSMWFCFASFVLDVHLFCISLSLPMKYFTWTPNHPTEKHHPAHPTTISNLRLHLHSPSLVPPH